MGALQDEKLRALRVEFVATIGTVNDLERLHVDALILGTPAGTTLYRCFQYWDEQTILAGNFNDRATLWLDGLGHAGPHIDERWKAYWEAIV